MRMTDVPLFPLNTVLFPQMVLPLYIFEQRYRTMISECLKNNTPFGVILLEQGEAEQEGRESVDTAVPCAVGTLARITEVTKTPDGRMLITTVGTERFRLMEYNTVKPYMTGDIEIWPDGQVDDPDILDEARQVRRAFEGYLTILMELAGKQIQEMDIPTEPDTLSYLVPHWLQISMSEKQRLLEAPDPHERLQSERVILQNETTFLEKIKEMAVQEGTLGTEADDDSSGPQAPLGYDISSRFSKN